MKKTIAVFNQKGGVGKTTTTINLAAALSMEGYQVLIIDSDPQGNATSGLGIDKNELEKSIYDGLVDGVDLKGIILETEIDKLHLLPSNADLAGAEIELANRPNREFRLSEMVEGIKDYYDYIVIDEVHHIAAPSYRGVVDYFEPQILLGLTATPERHDGSDILKDFNGTDRKSVV